MNAKASKSQPEADSSLHGGSLGDWNRSASASLASIASSGNISIQILERLLNLSPQAPSVEGAVSLGLTEEGIAERRNLSRFNMSVNN